MIAAAQGEPAAPIVKWLALAASAFWIHYCLVHDVLGLLTVDEIYFAHVFWMMRQGLETYSDFYSVHLPTYFHVLGPLVPPAPDLDLSFVWRLRAVSVAVIAAYAILLFALCRRDFLFLLPLLLLFVTFGRMAEIRPDTLGLLLFNAGWWWLLRGTKRKNILLAAAFSGAALFFAARASVMMVGMALICLLLCVRRKDPRTFLYLVVLAAGFAALVLSAYALDPGQFSLMLRSVYLESGRVTPNLTLAQRVLSVDRFILLAMIAVALVAAVLEIIRDKGADLGWVIAAAGVTQLALIAVDPSPFQYAYGWSALPVLAGIALLARYSASRLHAGLAFAVGSLAVGLVSLSLAQSADGRTPGAGSMLRITYDQPIDRSELRSATMPRLMTMMVRTERQQVLWNQLAVLTEICRRVRGPVLLKFYAHPICVRDARYDWAGLQWPPLVQGDENRAAADEFERLFQSNPPQLVAWGKQHYTPAPTPWGRGLLGNYDIHDGFALRRDRPAPARP